MRTITIEMDATEAIKMISACNSAIVAEEEIIHNVHNQEVIEKSKASIKKILEIKHKIKRAICNTYSDIL